MEQALGSRYVIGERLGGGGMGTVYRATRRDGGPDRAVKLLRPELAEDPVVLTRFVQERNLMLKLRDSHLVVVEDMIVDGETVAIVMELVAGGTLRRHAVDNGPLDALHALRFTRQVLLGLDVVHANGVVHRDVKPENVLLDRSEPDTEPLAKVSDFGIARLIDSPRLTATYNYIGTPHYCAPELADGAPATPAVDVYATAVMLYELVAGSTPFAGLPPYAVIKRQMEQAPPASPLIPEAVWSVIVRWLAADPAARPPDARQALLEVDDLLKKMSAPTIALSNVVPSQAVPLVSQPGQAPLRAGGLAASAGSAYAGAPAPGGLAPQPVAPDYLEVVHDPRPTPPPQGLPQQGLPQQGWPQHVSGQTTPRGSSGWQTDPPSIVPGFERTPPPVGSYTPRANASNRRKGVVIGAVAVVVLAAAAGTIAAVASGGGGKSPSAAVAPASNVTLRFPTETFPDSGVTDDRTWTVTAGKNPTLHGQLVFHTSKNVAASIDESLPKELVSNVSQVTFHPQPKVIQADPIVQYTLPAHAGQTITDTYDIPIPTSDVSMGAVQRWAAEQIAETGQQYRKDHTLLSMGFEPKLVTVQAGSHVQMLLVGKLSNGTPAPSIAYGGASFTSENPAIATVSSSGLLTGVDAGTTKVVARLGSLSASASVAVTASQAPTAGPTSSPGASATPNPTQSLILPTPATVAPTLGAPPTAGPTVAPPTGGPPTTVPPTLAPPTTLPPPPTTIPPTLLPPTTLPPPTTAPPTAQVNPAAPGTNATPLP